MPVMHKWPGGRFSLGCLFRPESVALIGAATADGAQVLANLQSGGFKGDIQVLDDARAIEALPQPPDLAVLVAPPDGVTRCLAALGAKGCFSAVVIGEADGLADPNKRAGVRVLGPGSFGIAVPAIGLNATRAHLPPPPGRLALVSQSAGLCRAVLDWAQPNGVGFSHIVGIGRNADIGFGLVLDWLSRDPGTGTVLLDIRRLKDRRAFLSAARAAARLRPVVAIGPGTLARDPDGAGEQAFEAALRRAGVLSVTRLEDLLAAAETLSRARPARGETLAIITNAIGPGRMAADAVLREGLHPAELPDAPDGILTVPPEHPDGLIEAAVLAAKAPDVGGVLLVHAPTITPPQAKAIATSAATMKVPLLISALGETTGAELRHALVQAGLAVFATPEQAVRGFLHLVQDRRNRAAARELPSSTVLSVVPDHARVRAIFDGVRARDGSATMQDEALAVLETYGIRAVSCRAVGTATEAMKAAAVLGFPAVVKLRQDAAPQDRPHGGLILDLHDASEVATATRKLLAQSGAAGLLVQHQAMRARELRIRVEDDSVFGPIIEFGAGGAGGPRVHDLAADLPPLNLPLAEALVRRSRTATLLGPQRGWPAANERAIAETLVRVSQLIVDFPEIATIELNPLMADETGALAVDAWIRLRPPGEAAELAIAPYPAELVEYWVTPKGEHLLVRPIRPEDAEQHGHFFHRLSPEDIRFRFFTAMREMTPEQTARLTQIDYHREMAFVAVRESNGDTVGVARLVCEASGEEGEFAVIVQTDMKGQGVATHLMQRLIGWARDRRLPVITGQILATNAPMLAFIRRLGFSLRRMPGEADVVEARLVLGAE